MATITGVSIATNKGGVLTLSGQAIDWCGSCNCNTSISNPFSVPLGTVGAGSFVISVSTSPVCPIKINGVTGSVAAVSGTSFNQLGSQAGVYQWMPGSLILTLVEAPGPLDPDKPHDCVNGYCLPKTVYNTPGLFPTLAACESGCAKNSNCTGECVSAEELAALQQAANNLQGRLCG